ncbi:ABC transporter ATP-binding protein [Cutibacterium equinum]|uniref:ABC transporter ATP-binding protein n=1 Tax=Cutibacterium equinum TaxID=3016342 RepID=A0ABY7QXE4_9ACTN|nr:ABC transporter ATP-binding protein [Cutibacterium equinum]WCC79733.1 ABC transporter ATP-binding protein [Cutibacterium equinum]
MTTTNHSRLSWAGDILLLETFRPLLTKQGADAFHRSLWLAGLQGVLEGFGLFAVIPTITAFVSGQPSMGLTWQGWVWVLAALAIVGAVVVYFQSTVGYLAAMDVIQKLGVRIGDQVASLPLGWFRSGFPARLSRLLTQGIMHLGEGLAHFTAPLVRGAATTVVMMVLSWFWSWQLGLSLLISIPVMYLILVAARALWLRGESVSQPTEQELAARIVEFCETQPVLRAAGRAGDYEPLRDARRANERSARKKLGLGVAANFLSGLGAQSIAVVLIVLAARMGNAGTLAPVATVAFVGVALRYAKVLEDVVAAALAVETSRKPVGEVDEILSAQVLPEPAHPGELSAPGEVSFEDVSFGYHKDHPVIHDVTFTAPAGGLTAIVGPSGAGKTTLFRLAARFWDVGSGTVRVGGLDVRDQTTEQLMSQLAMVFQDVYLYDSTLAQNIRIGNPDASDEQVRQAAALAGVDEIAARLPGGWDASVGEGGRRLSGGERQRVSVARALLKRAPILLFDEATSALDPENEAHVEAALAQLRKSSTILVIAHKLDTIRSADRIVVIDNTGRVCQVGTHDDLIASGGVYADLWHARERAEGWSLVGRE